MKRSRNQKPAWLLTVASVYALMPAYGCDLTVGDVATQPDPGELDAGLTSKPPDAGPHNLDAGLNVRPPDAAVDASSELPVDAGLTVKPPDAGPHNLDAGLNARPPDAAVDASS